MNLLDTLEFNQLVIFVKNSKRAHMISKILTKNAFLNTCITGDMPTEERIENFKKFKNFQTRLLVSTQLAGRGIDIEKVLNGAKHAINDLNNTSLSQNTAYQYACCRHYLHTSKHIQVENFITYDPFMYMICQQ